MASSLASGQGLLVQRAKRFALVCSTQNKIMPRGPAGGACIAQRGAGSRCSDRGRRQDPPASHGRPFFGRFTGTFGPSRRQRRLMRPSLADQPARPRCEHGRPGPIGGQFGHVSGQSVLMSTPFRSPHRCVDRCRPRTRRAGGVEREPIASMDRRATLRARGHYTPDGKQGSDGLARTGL